MHRTIPVSILGLAFLLAGCAGGVSPKPDRACPGPDGCGRVAVRPAEPLAVTDRRAVAPELDTLPLTPIPRSHPAIGRLRGQGSLSIGTATDGFVVGDARLPLQGPHHKVLEEHAGRGTNCGTDELVGGLLRAAERVARRYPGAVLTVGNLGRCGGGDIPWSVSHNSGRDVDIGFYLEGDDGRQYVPATMMPVGADGRVDDGDVAARFDVARNWWLVRSLMTDRRLSVQWIFVSSGLRRQLLEHARTRGEPAGLVERAAEVMAQPGRHRPHNDHFHVRIYCASDDLYEGCQDMGSNRSWYVGDGGRPARRVAELTRLSRSRDPAVRAAAATVLGRMGQPALALRLLRMLGDRDPGVAQAAAAALGELGVARVRDDVVRQIGEHPDDVVAGRLYRALSSLSRRLLAPTLAALLPVGRTMRTDAGGLGRDDVVRDRALQALCLMDRGGVAMRLAEAIAQPGVDAVAIDARLQELTGEAPADPASGNLVEAWTAWARGRAEAP